MASHKFYANLILTHLILECFDSFFFLFFMCNNLNYKLDFLQGKFCFMSLKCRIFEHLHESFDSLKSVSDDFLIVLYTLLFIVSFVAKPTANVFSHNTKTFRDQ
jgi:hypothetical protein